MGMNPGEQIELKDISRDQARTMGLSLGMWEKMRKYTVTYESIFSYKLEKVTINTMLYGPLWVYSKYIVPKNVCIWEGQ